MVIADDSIRSLTRRIYGPVNGDAAFERIATLLKRVNPVQASSRAGFTASDVVLITYGDTIRSKGRTPLQTLHEFAGQYLKESFSAIHLLPFFPYSSGVSPHRLWRHWQSGSFFPFLFLLAPVLWQMPYCRMPAMKALMLS